MASFEILSTESFKELTAVLEWFSQRSFIPVLIGGWAVFVYNSYFGSVDIDLVGPSMSGNFLDFIVQYERTHGYEEVHSLGLEIEVAYRKPITKGNRFHGYVEIDVCSYEADAGSFHEAPNSKLPYVLCSNTNYVKKAEFNEDAVAYVPRKSLLFLYKLKAFRDRSFDLKTKGAVMSRERREWIQTKAEKDGADLIALLSPNPDQCLITDDFDFKLLRQLVEDQKLDFALDAIKELPTLRKCVDRHPSLETGEVKKWVKNFFNNL
jgi:hypothetical protein